MDYPKSVPNIGLVNGKFVDENTTSGQVGSLIPAAWGSAITDEVLAVIAAAELEPQEGQNDQLAQAIQKLVSEASTLPVGALVAFPVNSPAPGFLELDGSVKSIAAYPDLSAYLGTTFNQGNEGAGNFRLPESRGEFLRGWDHGRGADAGRGIGSYQLGQNESHNHRYFDAVSANIDPYGGTATGLVNGGAQPAATGGYLATGGGDSNQVVSAPNTVNSGGNEARPRNLAVMWCIKAWNAPINQGNIDIAALATQVQSILVNGPVVGSMRNAKMTVGAASTSATFTADEVIVEDPVTKASYRLTSFNKAANLATVGIGGMDNGVAPTSGYVAWYAVFNPDTLMSGIVVQNATAGVAPNTYTGAFMPAGYTASALISVWPTNASKQLVIGHQVDREVHLTYVGVLSTAVQQPAFASLSIAAAVPLNARKVSVLVNISSTAASGGVLDTAASASGIGTKNLNFTSSAVGQWGLQAMHENLPIITPQTIYYIATNSAGTPVFSIFVTSYVF